MSETSFGCCLDNSNEEESERTTHLAAYHDAMFRAKLLLNEKARQRESIDRLVIGHSHRLIDQDN